MLNLDRFAQGRPDPQQAPAIASCLECGGEIYEGEEVLSVDGGLVHDDCFDEYAREVLCAIPVTAGEEETR